MNFEAEKEPYQKPKLTVIELRAEEVLAVGCKTAVSGPTITTCQASPCVSVGS